MEQEAIYVGIDVAKARVDVAVRPTGDSWDVPGNEAEIRKLVTGLKTLEPVVVLMEASGGLELPLVAALATEEVPVVVVNHYGPMESTIVFLPQLGWSTRMGECVKYSLPLVPSWAYRSLSMDFPDTLLLANGG